MLKKLFLLLFFFPVVLIASSNTPESIQLGVDYIPQNDNKSCATTSVAMIISYYEDQFLDPDTAWDISGSDENTIYLYGNDMESLARTANYYGYQSDHFTYMEIADVESFLSQGIPVMVNIKGWSATYHAILIIGYDKDKKVFYIHDPVNCQNKILPYSDLTNRWHAHLSSPLGHYDYSGFIVYPPKGIER